MDPFGIQAAIDALLHAWETRPVVLRSRQLELVLDLQKAAAEELGHLAEAMSGRQEKEPGPEDILEFLKARSRLARRHHTIYQEWLLAIIRESPGLQGPQRDRMMFWARQFLNMVSPANNFWTNFSAIRKYLDSDGETLKRGVDHFLHDVNDGHFLMRMADPRVFKIGADIACTPGAVVFRNEIMELIQYEPATEKTYPVPVLFIPPWINKFYILDLTPGSSLVDYMRRRGFTVFVISWKNPDGLMRDVTFDDYMLRGALEAVKVASSICRRAPVHAAGYCIGGTALAALMAWLNRGPAGTGKKFPVADWTLLSTLVDFSEPGDIGFLLTDESVELVEKMMEAHGYLSERFIELVFRLLRSDQLIWNNLVNGLLYGMPPPRSDLLYWNSDSTRLPAAMCSFCLREFYLRNRLAKHDGVVLGGRPIDLGRITQPLYAVGTQLDHICPWKSTFKICGMVGGEARYVLSSEGHITGIVNPPSETSRKKFWAGAAAGRTDPDEWLRPLEPVRGSWWEDWAAWLLERSPAPRRPPQLGSRLYPPLERTPGQYVLDR